MYVEVTAVLRHDHSFCAKAVDNDADQFIPAAEYHIRVRPSEHAEGLFGKCRQVKILKGLLPDPRLISQFDLHHLIHPVVFDDACRFIESNQVVVLIVPCESPGADQVHHAALFLHQFPACVPFTVFELDLPVPVHRLVQRVHVVIDALVAGLHAVSDKDRAVELLGFLFIGKPHKLADQLP